MIRKRLYKSVAEAARVLDQKKQRWCPTCSCVVRTSYWEQHLASGSHRQQQSQLNRVADLALDMNEEYELDRRIARSRRSSSGKDPRYST